MDIVRLGIIGAGNMAQAIVKGIAGGGMYEYLAKEGQTLRITVSDCDSCQLEKVLTSGAEGFKSGVSECVSGAEGVVFSTARGLVGVAVTLDNSEAVKKADYILLAVKPQSAAEVAAGLELKGKTIISIMAGVSLEKLKRLCGSDRLVRVMPNLNARVGAAMSTYTCEGLDARSEGFIAALLSSFGSCMKIPEERINAATGIAGSGPAFVFLFIKAFVDEALSYGFSAEEARLLAVKTVEGSAELIGRSGADTDIGGLVDAVCSKGGTTIEGVRHLRGAGFTDIVRGAVSKAIKRAEELGRGE